MKAKFPIKLLQLINIFFLLAYGACSLIVIKCQFNIATALVVHFSFAALLSIVVVRLIRDNNSHPILVIPLILTIVAGPFGALAAFLINVTSYIFGQRWANDYNWLLQIDDEFEATKAEAVFLNHQTLNKSKKNTRSQNNPLVNSNKTVLSFFDIMEWGTLYEKQRALNQIAKNFAPVFVTVIQKALSDNSYIIRAQAASVMLALEKRFMDEELHLIKELDVSRSRGGIRSLAALRSQKAESGILDPVSKHYTQALAVSEYLSHVSVNPSDHSAKLEAIKALTASKQYKYAIMMITREYNLSTPNLDPDILLIYSQCLFHLGRYQELSQIISKLHTHSKCPKHIVDFWRVDTQEEAVNAQNN